MMNSGSDEKSVVILGCVQANYTRIQLDALLSVIAVCIATKKYSGSGSHHSLVAVTTSAAGRKRGKSPLLRIHSEHAVGQR
jgi:hypothetical protein